ncbi:type II secretion system F family protein [Aquihabitans sp. G128]|uniref:type II secretion system F family protein n=1 Tax=Aquihabitans sp. G128 TaxID=2849779 RepID=UPI001C2375DF|nr:type II secretion system F family protein [Aquihabitans sp. G128]QXC62399.1 type II secretion system F family protein [Aquihabitans sp. G128]
MKPPLVAAFVLLWTGSTLLLSERRWFARNRLDDRLRPYLPGGWSGPARTGILSVESFREVVGPLATAVGDRLGRIFGVHDDLATRLSRVHSPLDATAVRVRQLTWSVAALFAAVASALVLRPPGALATLFVVGAPLLAFLVLEQQLSTASTRWQRRLLLELPVVSEQIGMLLTAGFSLGAALARVSERGTGACAQDLARVGERVRQGLSEADALTEWADLADVPAVRRLVGVLSLNRETGDLGHLIAEEARTIRREVQRQLAAQIDRRAQQVWVPVTVATLVPGTLFLAVPFFDAMRLFAS